MCYEQEEVGEEKEIGGDEDEGYGTEGAGGTSHTKVIISIANL